MKIIKNSGNKDSFGCLKPGQCFEKGGRHYIKCESEHCGIDLENGKVCCFESDYVVNLVNAKVVIE